MTTDHEQYSRVLAVLRRPLVGPMLLGIVLGGVPFGAMFSLLGDAVMSASLFGRMLELTPIAVVLSLLSTWLGLDKGLYRVFWRAFYTSFAACLPIPAIVCAKLALHWGYNVFSAEYLPPFIGFFFGWATVVALVSWFLALALEGLKIRGWRRLRGDRRG